MCFRCGVSVGTSPEPSLPHPETTAVSDSGKVGTVDLLFITFFFANSFSLKLRAHKHH